MKSGKSKVNLTDKKKLCSNKDIANFANEMAHKIIYLICKEETRINDGCDEVRSDGMRRMLATSILLVGKNLSLSYHAFGLDREKIYAFACQDIKEIMDHALDDLLI
jgi:hypothetical protein